MRFKIYNSYSDYIELFGVTRYENNLLSFKSSTWFHQALSQTGWERHGGGRLVVPVNANGEYPVPALNAVYAHLRIYDITPKICHILIEWTPRSTKENPEYTYSIHPTPEYNPEPILTDGALKALSQAKELARKNGFTHATTSAYKVLALTAGE